MWVAIQHKHISYLRSAISYDGYISFVESQPIQHYLFKEISSAVKYAMIVYRIVISFLKGGTL